MSKKKSTSPLIFPLDVSAKPRGSVEVREVPTRRSRFKVQKGPKGVDKERRRRKYRRWVLRHKRPGSDW